MNLQFYFEKLGSSEEFRNFLNENPNAYFCSGFFVIDKEKEGDRIHLDFAVPGDGKIFSFQMEEGINVAKLENVNDRILEEIPREIEFDFAELEDILLREMEKQNVKSKIQKIILIQKSCFIKNILMNKHRPADSISPWTNDLEGRYVDKCWF